MKQISTILAVLLIHTAAHADDHGGTLQTATRITQADTQGILDTAVDQDWFKLVVTSPGRHWIYSTGHTNTAATIYSSTGDFIASDDSSGSRENFEFNRVLSSGTYYFKINSGGSLAGTGAYTLSIRSPEFSLPFSGPNLASAITDPGEIILYRLVTPAPGSNWFYTTGLTDTQGTIYEDTGNFVASDGSSGNGSNFLLNRQFSAQVTIYLMVRIGLFSSPLGDFTLSWRHAANAIPFQGTRRDASMGLPGDLDLYRLEVTAASPVWIFSTGTTDVSATLYRSNWDFEDSNGSSGAGSNFLISRSLAAGTYWLLVGQETATSPIGAYTLNMRQTSTAIPINKSGIFPYQINPAGDLDLFVFETTGGLVRFTSQGTTDVAATLSDQGGNFIDSDDNSGVGDNFLIERTLTVGRYHLLVSGSDLSLDTGSYSLESMIAAPLPVASLSSSTGQITGAGSVGVSIQTTGAWSVSPLPAWVSASAMSGTASAEITFTLLPNHTNATRRATVRVGGIDYVITQEPGVGGASQPSLNIFPAVILAIPTEVGRSYRIEQSKDMINWQDTGISFIGNGLEMSSAIERTEANAFFRAVIE